MILTVAAYILNGDIFEAFRYIYKKESCRNTFCGSNGYCCFKQGVFG